MSALGTGLLNNCGCPFTQLTFEQVEQQRGQRNKFHFPGFGAVSLVYLLFLIAELWVCLFLWVIVS